MAQDHGMGEGGALVAKSLESLGVNHVFGIPGVHSLPVYEALRRSKIQHILARHELGAAFMADAYGRVTGRPGVVLTTGGPGVMNAFTGIATAYNDHSPVLLVTSHLPGAYVKEKKGALHELPAQSEYFKEVCVFTGVAERAADIPCLLARGWHAARKFSGPAYVEIPTDILFARAETDFAPTTDPRVLDSSLNSSDDLVVEKREEGRLVPSDLEEVIKVLAAAQAPAIWAGSGVVSAGACRELDELAGLMGGPVFTGSGGRGVLSEAHELSLGRFATHPLGQSLLKEADVLLAVGVRFSEYSTMAWQLALPPKIIRIDLDHGVHDCSVYPSDYALTGDAGNTLKQILSRMQSFSRKDGDGRLSGNRSWEERVRQVRAQLTDVIRNSEAPEIRVLQEMRRLMDDEAVLCVDLTSLGYWAGQYFPIYRPRTFLYAQGFGPLGFAVPAGIAAKIACPEKQVVVLCGDGGFMFTCQELAVAAEHKVNLTMVLVDDSCFRYLKEAQESRYGTGSHYSVCLHNPDFSSLVRSFGIRVIEAGGLAGLAPVLKGALGEQGPVLVHLRCTLD